MTTTRQSDQAHTSAFDLLRLARRPPAVIWALSLLAALSLLNPGLLALSIGPVFLPLYRVALLAGLAVIGAGRPIRASGSRRAVVIAVIWVVACVITLLASPARTETFGTFLIYALDAVLVLFLFRSARGRMLVTCVAQALAFLVAVSAAIAVAEYLFNTYLLPDALVAIRTRTRFGNLRGQGFAPHPLVLGTMCALLLFVPSVGRTQLSRWSWRALLVLGILASQSRGPILAALLGYLIHMVTHINRGLARRLVPILVVGLVVALALLPGDDTTTTSSESTNSASYRTELVHLAGDVVVERPRGLGFGQLSGGVDHGYLLRRFNGAMLDFGNTVDNQFVLALIYGGLPLLSGLLAISVLSIAALRRSTDALVLAMFMCLFGSMLFLALLSFSATAFMFWVLVAAAASSASRQS